MGEQEKDKEWVQLPQSTHRLTLSLCDLMWEHIHTAWNGNDADFEHVRQKRQRDNEKKGQWDNAAVPAWTPWSKIIMIMMMSFHCSIAIELNMFNAPYNFTIA